MRLFIAIPLPREARREALMAQKRLLEHVEGARPVPPENFHITLHFIGESGDLAGAAAACREAVRGVRPFGLKLLGYGWFEKGSVATSLLEIGGNLQELALLHETLESALENNGFPRGRGRLTPHVTLARSIRHRPEQDALGELPHTAFTADRIVLYESRNVEGRMVYTPLHTQRLS